MLGIMWVSWRASQGIGVFWRRWVRMKWFLSLEQTITSGPFLMAMVKDWRVPTCFAKSWFGFWTCDTPWKLLLFSIGTDEILPWDWNGRWRNDRIFKVLANCEAKMGPAAHLLVNETSLSSTSNEHGQADHGAVWGKELVSVGVARVGLVGVPFPCGAGRTFGGFEAWQTAALNAYKKPLLRLGGALEPLLSPCGGFCLRAWRVWGCPSAIAVAL